MMLLPPGCTRTDHLLIYQTPYRALRVVDETRTGEPGKRLMCDDTICHEAWNYSDRLRVVMICDVGHPMLTELERELVSQTVQGLLAYYGDDADLGEL